MKWSKLVNWKFLLFFITILLLDVPGIESRWGRDIPHPFRSNLGPTQPPTQWVPGLSRR